MFQDNERYLTERGAYYLRVPKVPRQSVEVFGRDVKNGDYGLSAEKIDVIFSYVNLQRTLRSFDDLTFPPSFLDMLPEAIRGRLGDNFFPGIALADLEIPTTDKILLARMLAADRLTGTLSQTPVEVWVTPQIQKDFEKLALTTGAGLQQIDYSQLSLQAKLELVDIMEHQQAQVHVILAARQRFPKGVPPLGFLDLLLEPEQRQRTTFDVLQDLELQYKVAQQALDNPLLVQISKIPETMSQKQGDDKTQRAERQEELDYSANPFPIQVEEEVKGDWWNPGGSFGLTDELRRYNEVFKRVAAYLRPRYADRSIYDILGADSDQAREEVLAAFWRTGCSRHIHFGDEGWIRNDLYLNPDGNLELHFRDEVWGDRDKSTVTGSLIRDPEVAVVDQAIKWIQAEMLAMQKIRGKWEEGAFDQNPLIEATLAAVLGLDRTAQAQEEIDGLPKWFVDALEQEVRYYQHLIKPPRPTLGDLTASLFSLQSLLEPTGDSVPNRLKTYFELSNARLEKDRRLISNPEELYKDLDLDPSADVAQIRRAYRRIAQETKAIQIGLPDEFNPEKWQSMNDRFIRATRAYQALSRRQLGETRVTTLGQLTVYFKNQ